MKFNVTAWFKTNCRIMEELRAENKRLKSALIPFATLRTAVFEDYPDDVIIRCELTAGEIRAAVLAVNSLIELPKI